MKYLRPSVIAIVVVATSCISAGQDVQGISSLTEYLDALNYPDSLSLRLTGVFRKDDFETYRHMTIDPFADAAFGRWSLVRGERYDYEVTLATDGDWRLRSLALSVLGQTAVRTTTASPSEQLSVTGSFIARYGGIMLPHYRAEGEAGRDATVRLATLVLPDPSLFNRVETADPGLKLARLDVLQFVNTCEALGGEAVLSIDAPEGSDAKLWTIGYPEEAVTLPIGQRIGTRTLPSAPWAVRVKLPEGMTVDDLPEGTVGLDLNAEGILPDWLNRGANPTE